MELIIRTVYIQPHYHHWLPHKQSYELQHWYDYKDHTEEEFRIKIVGKHQLARLLSMAHLDTHTHETQHCTIIGNTSVSAV